MTAELLHRAADLIEQRAAAALGGTWEFFHGEAAAVWRPSPVDGGGMWIVPRFDDDPHLADHGAEVARWIAMLGPQIAGPLAAWLRAAAVELDEDELYANKRNDREQAAIAFACAILGEDQ